MGELYEFGDVESIAVGAIGLPGRRTFYVQVRAEGQRVTVKCEKQQVQALAQYLDNLLDDLPAPSDRPLAQSLELVLPVEPASFTVGPIGLAFDQETDRFVLVLEEFVVPDPDTGELDPDDVSAGGKLRFHITRGQALAFAEHGESVVAAGRPPCGWCGLPMDPDGHACPKMN
jgi:hypothetical protein